MTSWEISRLTSTLSFQKLDLDQIQVDDSFLPESMIVLIHLALEPSSSFPNHQKETSIQQQQ